MSDFCQIFSGFFSGFCWVFSGFSKYFEIFIDYMKTYKIIWVYEIFSDIGKGKHFSKVFEVFIKYQLSRVLRNFDRCARKLHFLCV